MEVIRPLNYLNYNKIKAEKYLNDTIGYVSYGRKHGESIFTKFFQNYILPKKHNIDKRIAHYSSLILSNQMDRNDALKKLKEPLYDNLELINDKDYIANKLNINSDYLDQIIDSKPVNHEVYKNWNFYYKILQFLKPFVSIISKKLIKKYF